MAGAFLSLQQLMEAESRSDGPAAVPRDAATLVLVDRTGPTPKVLLGRRHDSQKFMPGKFVFPGGSVDPIDRVLAARAQLDPRVEARLMRKARRPSRILARALALAAIRETFEETGILIGVPREHAPASNDHEGWAALAERGCVPDLSGLYFVARAITPPGRSRRFDTRFFTADAAAITFRLDGVVRPDTELVELVWLPITEAARLDMPAITRVALEGIDARGALGHDRPVPYYRVLRRQFSHEFL